MVVWISICIIGTLVVMTLLRRDQVSLGLPLAYLMLLLLQHLPGAFVHVIAANQLDYTEYVEVGIRLTAIGVVAFVIGLALARGLGRRTIPPVPADRRQFALFSLVGGWMLVYGFAPLTRVPSIGALVESGGAVWMLGTLLGLRSGLETSNFSRTFAWAAALFMYVVLMLLFGGFLSYGAAAATVVLCVLAVAARHYARVLVSIALISFIGLTIFVNYFENRDHIRESVWGGASMVDRVGSVLSAGSTFHFVDLGSTKDLSAIDTRLNQNLFVGISASRLEVGQVDYLKGSSLFDGVISLIPRAMWPDKPVTGGSGTLVADLTGLRLNEDTSWGIGNVLEFYGNFGLTGVIVGFLGLGWLLGTLDLKAAIAEREGRFDDAILWFLPAVPLVGGSGGSVAETIGAAVAALGAAYAWRWLWRAYKSRQKEQALMASRFAAAARQRASTF